MDAAFTNAEDNLFGAINHLINLLTLIIGQFGNFPGGGDQAPQHRCAFDDAGIVVHIERGWRAGD